MIFSTSQEEGTYPESWGKGESTYVYEVPLDARKGDLLVLNEVTRHGDLEGTKEVREQLQK